MRRRITVVCSLLILSLVFIAESWAMPNFARKYNADCSMCHSQVPKLNRIGYEFRLAGYRLPSEIGKEEKPFNFGDFFAARFQERYRWAKHKDVNSANDSTNSQLEFFEFTFYPLTGSWGKYFASIGEFSMTPDDIFEVENAYIRGVYGDENGWFQARIGVMHPWEGFGASDRPLGNTRPLFQKVPAIGSPYFLWNLDEMALELGYHLPATGTSIAARISNGILWKEDGSGVAEPAQGGGLTKPKGTPASNDKDYQVFVNQFFAKDSAISASWYWGAVPFPDPHHDPSPAELTRDTFYRLAAYANYFVIPQVNLLGGYEYGHDSLGDPTVATLDGKQDGSKVGNSHGYFGEIDFHPMNQLAFGARYDFYDPSNKVDHNNQIAYTVSGNWYIWHGFQLIADYQHKDTEQPAGGKNKDDTVEARLILIW